MKIDNRHIEQSYPFASPLPPARVAETTDAPGPIAPRPGALLPHFNQANLPVPLPNTEEQRRDRAMQMAHMDVDIRSVPPREMSGLGLELYVSGHLSWDDYAELAFQPQLHPRYDATIGALEGKSAEPDTPQDFVRVWEERLSFDVRYNGDDTKRIQQTERIVGVMRQLAGTTFYEV